MKTFLDRENYGQVYKLIQSPVWFSVEVDLDPKLVRSIDIIRTRFDAINAYLDSVYEARRADASIPPIPTVLEEIIKECHAEVAAGRAQGKKQKPQDTEAASSTPSPAA